MQVPAPDIRWVKSANWLNHLDYEWDSPIWKQWLAELTKHNRLIRYDEDAGNGLSQWDVKEETLIRTLG